MKKSINTEIIINTGKEKVWEILTNFNFFSEWNPFMIKIKGKLKMGEKLEVTLKTDNKNMVFNPTIIQLENEKKFSWLGSLFFRGLFDGLHSFTLEEIDASTTKLLHSEEFSGVLSSLIFKKIGEQTKENFVKMNLALKSNIENSQK